MRCHAVHAWLLVSRMTEVPPLEVCQHLERCPKCRSRRQHLRRLEQAVEQLPEPAGDALAKARFWQRLERNAPPDQSRTSPPRAGPYGAPPGVHGRRRPAARGRSRLDRAGPAYSTRATAPRGFQTRIAGCREGSRRAARPRASWSTTWVWPRTPTRVSNCGC